MPGEIGASIFPPRPARGYRFHSLQVEIIAIPHKPAANIFIKSCSPKMPFVLQSEYLTTGNRCRKRAPDHDTVDEMAGHRYCKSSTAEYGRVLQFGRFSTPEAITRSRPPRPRHAPMLAGSGGREEDRRSPKINGRRPMQSKAQIDQILRQKSD